MTQNFQHLVKDLSKIDLEDICSDWQWKLVDQKSVALVTLMGDMFLVGKNAEINSGSFFTKLVLH
jgi:hypothetical protein